ncbi:unnamed protein product (macronuclear) [Paramecium tetraurelia]|uniref:Uncharacterized protein n=1 Tax=Paramecium tetraurelia TaxID=5888 RepID=A0DS33_PARTE|nr:uncharacterized protein GSPATT00019554001 [Paramecium tetraurelia]CAK85850.1 unnamed protein product [Paramecium tetraurelia]|eukprot:XP_001453247.1 hypothetical protein (macronuclear) [Paramecium tetraurelia strain d4-2]
MFEYYKSNMEQKTIQDISIPYNFDVKEIQQKFGIEDALIITVQNG